MTRSLRAHRRFRTPTKVERQMNRSTRMTVRMALAVGLALGVSPAVATTITSGCIDDLFPGTLNCTANDAQVSRARDPIITNPCDFPGDTVTFSATFDVFLNAATRYDVGLYFASDGDPNNNGALTGTCSITTLPTSPDPP